VTSYRGDDLVSRLAPDEGLGVGVVGIEELADRPLEFPGAAMNATLERTRAEQRKPAAYRQRERSSVKAWVSS